MPTRPWISADRVAALILLVAFAAYGLRGSSLESSLGVDVVGPDFYPTAIGILGVVLSVLLLVGGKPAAEDAVRLDEGSNRVVVVTVGLMLAYVLSLDFLGFPIATVVFLMFAARFLGCPTWPRSVVFGFAGTAVAIALFHYGLAVRLPQGDLIRLW